jgi:hypothetical protein
MPNIGLASWDRGQKALAEGHLDAVALQACSNGDRRRAIGEPRRRIGGDVHEALAQRFLML